MHSGKEGKVTAVTASRLGFQESTKSCVCQNRGYLITAKRHKRVFDALESQQL